MDPTAYVVESSLLDKPLPVAELRASVPSLPGCGGYVCFEGLIRNINHGKDVTKLEYEAYPLLAEKELRQICEEAAQRFKLSFVRTLHRTGTLEIGETAVIVQVMSKHRTESFDGCRFVIDQLKKRVPIWKKEHYSDGTYDWTRCHHE
jgi:molybdopterin synthase catalytic subunit